jgi:tape measure domain-containing protein
MADFPFVISGDATQANRAADSVLDRLETIRRQAAEASKGMSFDKLSAGFAKLADAMRKEQAALSRTTQLHQQLTAANAPLVQSFGGMAEAIRREQEALERIQGPVKRYQAEIQTLDSLLRRGAITQQQHTAATSAASRTFSQSQAPAGGGLGAALGGMRGGLAAAGIGVGVSEIGQMVDQFQNLQNRLRFLAGGDMQKVNVLFTELQGIAGRTRSELATTTEGFVKISMATKQMGLSQSETLAFTERLNKAITLSGATTAGAQAAMLQLSQGLSAGALRGEEFNSVIENAPVVIQTIATSLGMTTGELRKFAFDGKLTADIVIDAFKKMGSSLDKDFGSTVPTVSQSMTTFKNEMMVTVGQLDKQLGLSEKLGGALSELGSVIKAVVQTATPFVTIMSKAGEVITMLNPLYQIKKLLELADAFDSATTGAVQLMEREEMFAKRRGAYVFALMQGAEAVKQWHKEQTEMNLRLQFGAAAADAFHKAIQPIAPTAAANAAEIEKWSRIAKEMPDLGKEIDSQLNKAARTMEQLEAASKRAAEAHNRQAEELRKLAQALLGSESASQRAIREGAAERAAIQAEIDRTVQAEIDSENRAAAFAAESMNAKIRAQQDWRDAVTKATEEVAETRLKFAEQEAEASAKIKEAWASGLGSIAAEFVNMAVQGELSMDKLAGSLAKLALQIAAMQIGGPWGAMLGSFAGGLQGFAHGGIIHEGNGGTDSQLVAFRKSPNERVTIETPQQRRDGSLRGGGGPAQVSNLLVFQNDPREVVAAMGTRAGAVEHVKLNRQFNRRR